MNPFKRAAQESKAAKLTLAIEDLARASSLSALEVFGRLRAEQWLTLSVIVGQKKPKAPRSETQLIILGHLRECAKGAA